MHKQIQIVFTCVLFFFFFNAFSQGHSWSSADVIASSNDEVVTSINAVPGGYVVSGYVTGKVAGITENQLYGGKDGFVAKYSSDSMLEWIFTIGTSSDDTIKTTTGPDGSIYVYGNLKGIVNCGGRTQHKVIGSDGDSGAYIIKYSPEGTYQSHFQSTGNLKLVDVQISEQGKVIALCDFIGKVRLDTNTYNNTYSGDPYNSVFFLLEGNNLEKVVWSNTFYGASEVKTIDLTLSNNQLLISAYSNGSSFGVYRYRALSSYSGKRGFILSSINLTDGLVNWVNFLGIDNTNSSAAGLSYSNDNLFFQVNTKDSLSLQGGDLVESTVNTSNKSYTVKLDVNRQEVTGLKEFRSSDSLNVVDIKALNDNVYLLASYKKDLRSNDFVLNANVDTEVSVIKLDSNLNFWYAHKAKERGDFIEPVALDVFSNDGYYMAGNFSKRVYLDTLSVEYLPSNSKKIFSAKAIGTPPKPVDQGDLIDDEYCFVKNADVNVVLPVLQNDLAYSDNKKIINKKPDEGKAEFVNDEIIYEFSTKSNYITSFEYFVPPNNNKDPALVTIQVRDSTILAKDSSVCGREDFSVNLYSLYGYSVDTIEFRWNGEIVNNVPLDVAPIQVDIIKVNKLCDEQKTTNLNKNVPILKQIDTSLVSCSVVLDVSKLYAEYSAPFRWSANVLSFNEVTKELEFADKGDYTVFFDKLLPVECFLEELETNIEVVLPVKGVSSDAFEVYPLDEINLSAEETPLGENKWEVIVGDASITYSENGNSTVIMGQQPSEIEYISIDEHKCVFALDTFKLSIKEFFVPNAFSPNNDGLNDAFLIKGTTQIEGKNLKVFNTQGLKVFEARDYKNDWQGTSSSGEVLPEDVYYFEYTILNKDYKGYLEIKR